MTQQSNNNDELEIGKGGDDVIVVEWSDESVEYGERLRIDS